MNQLDSLCDSRFNYTYDNPFNGPTRKESLTKLKEYISNNIDDFKNIDWIEDSRCYNIPLKKAFNEPITKTLEENESLCYYTCNFLNKINSKLSKQLNSDLKQYILSHLDKPDIITNMDGGDLQEDTNQATNQTNNETLNTNPGYFENYEQINNDLQYVQTSEMTYKTNSELFSYDSRPGKTLSYEEVCELTLNLARSQLQNIIKKDDSVLFAESREKNRLITELNKYLKNSEIASKLNLEPNNLSISQLQQSLDQAKDLYDTIKVTHVIEKGLDLFNLGYSYTFPNGIKIPGKNKAIKLNGVTGSFKQLLFDRTSPLNIAFKNILEKHHISVSDEFVVGLSSVEAILKKIEIVDLEDPKKKSKKKSKKNNKSTPAVEELSSSFEEDSEEYSDEDSDDIEESEE